MSQVRGIASMQLRPTRILTSLAHLYVCMGFRKLASSLTDLVIIATIYTEAGFVILAWRPECCHSLLCTCMYAGGVAAYCLHVCMLVLSQPIIYIVCKLAVSVGRFGARGLVCPRLT
jgi:hypothetical protein